MRPVFFYISPKQHQPKSKKTQPARSMVAQAAEAAISILRNPTAYVSIRPKTKKSSYGLSYVNACDEFTNYKHLTEDEKIKRLSNNDQVVADSLYQIFLNIYLNPKSTKK